MMVKEFDSKALPGIEFSTFVLGSIQSLNRYLYRLSKIGYCLPISNNLYYSEQLAGVGVVSFRKMGYPFWIAL